MEGLLVMVVQQSQLAISKTKFDEFNPALELWSDYWAGFEANVIPHDKEAEGRRILTLS